jgi:protein phosphatase
VAAAYCGLGPALYRKTSGRLSFSARLLLAPCLLGQQLSLYYYRRQCAPWNEIVPGVWMGVKLTDREALHAKQSGVTTVLDLTTEFSEARPFLELPYCNLRVLDLTQLTSAHLHETANFIARHSRPGIVYVHCKVGYSRSAAAVGAFLLKSGHARNTAECLEHLRRARPGIILRSEVQRALSNFAKDLNLAAITPQPQPGIFPPLAPA